MRQPGAKFISYAVVPLILLSLSLTAQAQSSAPYLLTTPNVGKRADAMLGLMAYSVVPDLTTSSLSISAGSGSSSDTGLTMSQLAGGFTWGKDTPLYLEGGIAYSRYDPTFIASNGSDTREVPVKWNAATVNGGVGWDFPIARNLVLRPIFNFSVGSVASDITLASWFVERKSGSDFDFLQSGTMNAYGLGGSVMLDYEDYKPEREIDVEWRYSNLYLRSFGESANGLNASARAESTSLWSRWRAPTGMRAMDRPVRYVLEAAHSTFLGSQAGLLGFNHLTSLGVGLELDSSAYDIIITRTRFVLRYCFGENVEGVSLGIAVSF